MSAPAIALPRPRPTVRRAPRATVRRPPRPARLRLVDTAALPRVDRMRRVLAGVTVVIVGSVMTTVGLHVFLAQTQFEIDELRAQAAAEEHRYEQARLEVAQLASPARVVPRAQQLGMVPAADVLPTTVGVPIVPPDPPPADGTATTLSESWPRVKPYLAARP